MNGSELSLLQEPYSQEAFIQNFVLKYPRMYVRLISYNYKFDTETLLKYRFLLSWHKTGILGNPKIIWTKELKNIFKDSLNGFDPLYKDKYEDDDRNFDYLNSIGGYENLKITLRRGRTFIGEYKLDDITIDFIRSNKDQIVDWRIICSAFKEIDFYFAKEFYKYLDLGYLISNPFIDWNDFKIIRLFINNYIIIYCKYFWDKFLSHFVSAETIPRHLESMNSLEKIARIHWKSDRRYNGNAFKYLVSIYVLSEFDDQRISSGYYYDPIDYHIGPWDQPFSQLKKTDIFSISDAKYNLYQRKFDFN